MSIIETYRSEFAVFYYDEDPLRGSQIQGFFKSRGYRFEFFSSRGLLFEALQRELPHLLVLHYQPLNLRFHDLLKKARELSDEMDIVALFKTEFWPGVHKLLGQSLLTDAWSWPVLDETALQLRLDQNLERTIYRYIAEQRSPATETIARKLEELLSKSKSVPLPMLPPRPSQDWIELLEGGRRSEPEAVEQMFESLKRSCPNSDFLFLRAYPAKEQLLVYRTSFADARFYRGQSFPFVAKNSAERTEAQVTELKKRIQEQLRCEDFDLYPVEIGEHFYGFFMVIQGSDAELMIKLARQMGVFLRNQQLETSQVSPDRDVDLDQVVSSRQFPWILSREISRGRRLKSPVSLLICQLEFVYEEEQQRGRAVELIGESLRPYDLLCRLENGQIAIVLPHCNYEDAAIKAEGLRRQLVARGVQTQSTPLRLCFGVSEFPRLSIDSDSLLQDTRMACAQVYASGKNKVCLFTRGQEFQPEFQVT